MGKLIPAGTGISYYQDVDIDMNIKKPEDMFFDDDFTADEEVGSIDDDDEYRAEWSGIANDLDVKSEKQDSENTEEVQSVRSADEQ